jgi:phage gp46-like protein
MLKESDSTVNEARQAHSEALARIEEAERQLADSVRCLSEEQKKHRLVLDEREELTDQLTQANLVRSELLEQIAQLQNELSRVEAVAALCGQYQVTFEID